MHLWNIDALIEQLKNNQVTQNQQFQYVVAFSLLLAIGTAPFLHIDSQYNALDSLSTFVEVVITILGLILCFNANQKADDKDFILRFFTLGLPITIRFIVFVIAIAFLFGIFSAAISTDETNDIVTNSTTLAEVALTAAAEIIYYLYFASKFKKFSHAVE